MAIVKVHNRQRGITYVYESVSYWDKDLKQPRSHRKLVGKLDPESGAVIPTGTRGRKKSGDNPGTSANNSDTDYKALYASAVRAIAAKDDIITELRRRLAATEKELSACRRSMKKSCDTLWATLDETEDHAHG